MANERVAFITADSDGQHGSSLYVVTAHWVLRCSGNNTGGRHATTFIRRRSIVYRQGGQNFNSARLGACPLEGTHEGHPVVQILSTGTNLDLPATAPDRWIEANGVSWATAVAEVDAAAAYARETAHERASRLVGSSKWTQD